ncbi:hypothetical protein HHI36_017759 [Cryptolaemus montrouzieri]|uniref:Uncharacterized protein n=1 Tax=Cryptolaemus montrouzieri TaxID=559131 RepID=A0ABD2NNY2_9CUCU
MLYPIPNFILLHGVGDIIYNSMMIKEKLQLIEKTFGTEDRWYYDAGYQKYVEIILKRCTFQHLQTQLYANYMRQLVHRILIPGSSAGILLSALFYLCMTMNQSNAVILRSSGVVFMTVYFVLHYSYIGQKLQDESELLYQELCKCPWYLWDESNKKMYLMFLIFAKTPLIFKSINLMLNYTLIVSLARSVMSLLTAIRKLTS